MALPSLKALAEILSQDLPPTDLELFEGLFKTETPTGLFTCGSAIIEAKLISCILKRFGETRGKAKAFLGLTTGYQAPASTFSARIELAYLLGITTPEQNACLDHLRRIRNHFAHNTRPTLSDKKILEHVLGFLRYLGPNIPKRFPFDNPPVLFFWCWTSFMSLHSHLEEREELIDGLVLPTAKGLSLEIQGKLRRKVVCDELERLAKESPTATTGKARLGEE